MILLLCKIRADLLVTHPMRALALLGTIECSSTGTLEQITTIGPFKSRAGVTRLHRVPTNGARADFLVNLPMRTLALLAAIECSSTGTLEQITAIGCFPSRAGIARLHTVVSNSARADFLVTHPMRALALLGTIECSSTRTLE